MDDPRDGDYTWPEASAKEVKNREEQHAADTVRSARFPRAYAGTLNVADAPESEEAARYFGRDAE